MQITSYTLEKIEDPFGILTGERYEYFLDIEVDEDDELFSENGLKIKVLYIVDDNGGRISHYHIIENTTERILEFELEEDEEQLIADYCQTHLNDLEM